MPWSAVTSTTKPPGCNYSWTWKPCNSTPEDSPRMTAPAASLANPSPSTSLHPAPLTAGLTALPTTPSRPPRRRQTARKLFGLLVIGAVLAGAGWGVRVWWTSASASAGPVITAVVTRAALPITVTERGELESSQTVDGRCEVEVQQIKIVSILPEGTKVTKGQEVVKFDTETLQKNFAEQEIKWKQ